MYLGCDLGGFIEVIETADVSFNGLGDENADDSCTEPKPECREPLSSYLLGDLRFHCNGKETCNRVKAEWVFTTDCDIDRTDVEQVTYMCILPGKSTCRPSPNDRLCLYAIHTTT